MATIIIDSGVNEREPTLISDGNLQDCDGAEYRVGQHGVYVARGRDLMGTISSVTGKAVYEAGFDGTSQYVVAHAGASYYYARVAATLAFTAFDSIGDTSLPAVGTHFANRHYIANAARNRRFEATATGITSFPIGMSESTYAVGVSVTQGAGSMSATIGLEYWVTEYDSARGIESLAGSTANTSAFSGITSVIVTVTGVSANPRADQIRWYRSTDGGGFPDGGLIRTTAIGTTQITDSLTNTADLTVTQYGLISVGGLDHERDEAPPVLSVIFGPFQDSLLGVAVDEPRVMRFTPAGFADSWPSRYGLPLETARRDEIITGVVMPGRIGIFCNDSVHVVYRLPRDSDSVFAAGEMMDVVTDARGCMSRRGATVFTPPGSQAYAAWVARDGIWASTLATSPIPLTDGIRWDARVNVSGLSSCRLLDDPANRRLIFIHRRASDSTHNTGVWYLDYQRFNEIGIRVTFGDHGPLADAATIATSAGTRRVISIDSRADNGQVYEEAAQDADDSELVDSSGSVVFRMRTKEFMPARPRGAIHLGEATWMHDAGPATVTHRFYFDRRDDNPEVETISAFDSRKASSVMLSRSVNSVSLELESAGTVSYGVHWVDIEGLDAGPLGGREGA